MNLPKIVILFSGDGTTLESLISTLHNKEVSIVATVTNNPSAKGIEIAKKYNIPVETIDSKKYVKREEFDRDIVKVIQQYTPNLTVLAGFMRILSPVFTRQLKAINLHPSLLPRNKGTDAIKKSYTDEYDNGGVTVHWVSSKLDDGEIILQKSIKKDGLSFDEYYAKTRAIEKTALAEAVRKVLGA